MIEIKSREEFEEIIKGQLVLADFYGTTCTPCKLYAAELEQVSYDLPFVTIVKVCTDKVRELSDAFHIRAVPTTMIYQNGEQKECYTGMKKADWTEKHLAEYLYA